jgi:hypothetical protein
MTAIDHLLDSNVEIEVVSGSKTVIWWGGDPNQQPTKAKVSQDVYDTITERRRMQQVSKDSDNS